MLKAFIFFAMVFIISYAAVPMIISLARRTGAVAIPGERHIHSRPTPKLGGIAIALGIYLVAPFVFQMEKVIIAYLVSAFIIFLLGLIDDLMNIGWRFKLIVFCIAMSIFIFVSDTWIRNIGNLFGNEKIDLDKWGIPFTFFAVFGLTNAINLIDGLNGLACGASVIAFISFAILAYISDNTAVFYLCILNLGAILALFRYNYPKARIFLGDTGSLFIGYSLSIMAILLTQAKGNVNPVIPVIILGIPIFDTLRVMITRIIKRSSPFKADKTHLHHLMTRSGYSAKNVVRAIWMLSILMSLLAFILRQYDSWLMLIVLLIVFFCMGIFINNLRIFKRKNF